MPHPVSIADVAAAAGVSKATVSRVLAGGYPHMREETRRRVEEAIRDLDYRPSTVARSLTSRRTYTLGILVSDVGNPFYADVIHGVEDAGIEAGYGVFLANSNYDLERGRTAIRSMIDKRVDGILIMSSTMSDDWLEEAGRNGVPVVVLDWAVGSRQRITGAIEVDYLPGIIAAVEHLWDLGHRRFAHISGPLSLQTSRDRRDAFVQALAIHGVPAEAVPVIEGDFHIEGGKNALAQLTALIERPTALFAANDLMAIGVLSAARSYGLLIPQDMSLVGLDDIWLASQTEPPLTTVALPRYETGSQAARMLLELVASGAPASEMAASRVSTHLVIRASTASFHHSHR